MRHVGADQATFVDATVIDLKWFARFQHCGPHMIDKPASATLLREIFGHDPDGHKPEIVAVRVGNDRRRAERVHAQRHPAI
jgi:hypothetical protein